MKPSSSRLQVFSLFILVFSCSVSWATLDSNGLNNFLHCLNTNSQSSHPITAAIYTRNNSSFSSIFHSYVQNQRFVNSPQNGNMVAIVTALHESHVQATVICCKAHDLLLRTRSGGHDYDGLSYSSKVPFVLLDMFNLQNIDINLASETMWVQAGATLGEVYYNIANKTNKHAFPGGLCPTVGVGGHFSGGGFGTLVRKYGLTADNVLDAQVVDVNGRILDREAMGEDLFWAINGGGGGSFAVVLSWKAKLVKVPKTVTVFHVKRGNCLDLVHKWQQVSSKLHEDIFLRLELRAVENAIQASFIGLFLGKIERLLPLLDQIFPELGLQREDYTETSWIESVLFFYSRPRGTPTEVLVDCWYS